MSPTFTATRPFRKVLSSLPLIFPGESVLLLAVALFARGDDVAFCAFAPADDRHDMVHRQRRRGKLLSAIMADPGGAPPLPPLARAQLARLCALAPHLLLADDDVERRAAFAHRRAHFFRDLR